MIDQWLNGLSLLIAENSWVSPLLALLAGVLTSVTPCALSSVPLVIGYVGGTRGNEPKKAFWLSLTFALGMAVTFMALGTAASLLGKLMRTSGRWWYFALGVLMVLMALQTWEVFQFIPSTYLTSRNTKKGYAGAMIAGTSIGFVRKITASSRYGRFSAALKIIMGTAIRAIALYMFYSSF